MGFKIKNSLTGEFEKLPILTLKGEKGETGGVEEYNKVDYMGNKYETLKQANDANVEYAVKTAIGEFNYLDYEGQNITATNTLEGRSKSAILKGQTLVNFIKNKYNQCNLPASQDVVVDGANAIFDSPEYRIKQVDFTAPLTVGKEYLFIVNVKSMENTDYLGVYVYDGTNTFYPPELRPTKIGLNVVKYIPTSPIKQIAYYVDAETEKRATFGQPMIIEYQDGMENWDIPYFEGMTSVKAPVLKTTGKNLINMDNFQPYYNAKILSCNANSIVFNAPNDWAGVCVDLNLKPNTKYHISYECQKDNSIKTIIRYLNDDGTLTGTTSGGEDNFSFMTKYNGKVRVSIESNKVQDNIVLKNIQLEESLSPTPFEPYKSNTLSTPEDLELRGIDDIKDELNLMTGELTQHIKEVVFDGSDDEVWSFGEMKGDNYKFGLNLKTDVYGSGDRTPILSDKFAVGNLQTELTQEQVMIYNHIDYMELRLTISPNKLTSNTGQALKDYLKANPFTIQYALETPTIKTVDLSDNHIYSYQETTHYDCSSAEGSLVPTLSVKVPTDVQATIAQQRETIQTLNSENERLNQIQEALKASMLDSQVQLMNLSWNTDFEVFTLRESIATKDSLMDSRTGSNIDKFSQAKFIIENDCPDLEKLNSQIEYYFSKDVFSQEQFEELTDLISIVKGENGCEY